MANNNIVSNKDNPDWMKEQDAYNAEKNNQWAKMLQMMQMVPRMTDQQMMGFALGKLLRGGWDNYKDKRDAAKRADIDNQQKMEESAKRYYNNNPIASSFTRMEPLAEGQTSGFTVKPSGVNIDTLMTLNQAIPAVTEDGLLGDATQFGNSLVAQQAIQTVMPELSWDDKYSKGKSLSL